jgi:hypothetical protein
MLNFSILFLLFVCFTTVYPVKQKAINNYKNILFIIGDDIGYFFFIHT